MSSATSQLLRKLASEAAPYLAHLAFERLLDDRGRRRTQPTVSLNLYYACLRHCFAALVSRARSLGLECEDPPGLVFDRFPQSWELVKPALPPGEPPMRLLPGDFAGVLSRAHWERHRDAHQCDDAAPGDLVRLLTGLDPLLLRPVVTLVDFKNSRDGGSIRMELLRWKGTARPQVDAMTATVDDLRNLKESVAYLELELDDSSRGKRVLWVPLDPFVYATVPTEDSDFFAQSLQLARPTLDPAITGAWHRDGNSVPCDHHLKGTVADVRSLRPLPAVELELSSLSGLPRSVASQLEEEGWTLGKKLGAGAFGVVVEASKAGSSYAVKVLHDHVLVDRVAKHALAQARRLDTLDSVEIPGLVRHPYALSRVEGIGVKYIVMDRLRGKTLDLGARQSLSWEQRADLILGLCRALKSLHMHGVVHRDIHPRNIMLVPQSEPDEAGAPSFIDLGLASWRDDAGTRTQTTRHAAAGWGIPPFAPKSQRTGEIRQTPELWPAADVHGVAHVIAFVCAPGRVGAEADLRSLSDEATTNGEQWAPLLETLAGVVEDWRRFETGGAGSCWNGRRLYEVVTAVLGGESARSLTRGLGGWSVISEVPGVSGRHWVRRSDGALGLLHCTTAADEAEARRVERALGEQARHGVAWIAEVLAVRRSRREVRAVFAAPRSPSTRLTAELAKRGRADHGAWLMVALSDLTMALLGGTALVFDPDDLWFDDFPSRCWIAQLRPQADQAAWGRFRRRVMDWVADLQDGQVPLDPVGLYRGDAEGAGPELEVESPGASRPQALKRILRRRPEAVAAWRDGRAWLVQRREIGGDLTELAWEVTAALQALVTGLLVGPEDLERLRASSARVRTALEFGRRSPLRWPTTRTLADFERARTRAIEQEGGPRLDKATAEWQGRLTQFEEASAALDVEMSSVRDRLRRLERDQEKGPSRVEGPDNPDRLAAEIEDTRGLELQLERREAELAVELERQRASRPTLASALAAARVQWSLGTGRGEWTITDGEEPGDSVVVERIVIPASRLVWTTETAVALAADSPDWDEDSVRPPAESLVAGLLRLLDDVGSPVSSERLAVPDRLDPRGLLDPQRATAAVHSLAWYVICRAVVEQRRSFDDIFREQDKAWFSSGAVFETIAPNLLRPLGPPWSEVADEFAGGSVDTTNLAGVMTAGKILRNLIAEKELDRLQVLNALTESRGGGMEGDDVLASPLFRLRPGVGVVVWCHGSVALDREHAWFGAPPLARLERRAMSESRARRIGPQ